MDSYTSWCAAGVIRLSRTSLLILLVAVIVQGVKTLVGRRALPDMSAMADVSEFLTKSGYGSVRIPYACTLVVT